MHTDYAPNGKYARAAVNTRRKYDIIFVDGRDRVNCVTYSVKTLKRSGVVILDDSERIEYQDGVSFLLRNGYKKLDFWGLSPGFTDEKCTSIFYRRDNCFKI